MAKIHKESKGRRKDAYQYEKGQTPARYGIGNYDKNGKLIFMDESSFSMGWSGVQACVWPVPPTHYCQYNRGDFIINFNKKTAPVKIGEHTYKGNYKIL